MNPFENPEVFWYILSNLHRAKLCCSGLLHYKPRNANLRQYSLLVSIINCAPKMREKVSVSWGETVY